MSSSLIDVAIGLALTYTVFSITCTVLTEWWSRIRVQRAAQLVEFIRGVMLTDEIFADRFFCHPLVQSLRVTRWKYFVVGAGGWELPSYIPPRTFALVVIDLAFRETAAHCLELLPPQRRSCFCRSKSKLHGESGCQCPGSIKAPDIGESVAADPEHHSRELMGKEMAQPEAEESAVELDETVPPQVYETLRALTNCTRNSCQHTQERIETWFIESMKRLTGQYTRYAYTVTLVAAILVTVAFNLDSARLAQDLYQNPAKAQAAVALAAKVPVGVDSNTAAEKAVDAIMPSFRALQLPIGWRGADYTLLGWLGRILGWAISIGALSLGAPFWFDTLNRIVRLRQAGDRPQA